MKCSVCQTGDLVLISEEMRLASPSPGSDWSPGLVKHRTFQCELCDSTFTQRNDEHAVLQSANLEELVWGYLEKDNPQSLQKLASIGEGIIPTLIQIVMDAYRDSGKKTEQSIEQAHLALLLPIRRLLHALDYRAHSRLCDFLGGEDPDIRKTACLLLNAIEPPDRNLSPQIRSWLDGGHINDRSSLLLLYLYLDEAESPYGDENAHRQLVDLARQTGLANPGLFGKIMNLAASELMGRS